MSAGRVERLLTGFEAPGIDALLVTAPIDLRYLTGFTGSNALAVVGPELRRFVTDFRYVEQSAAQVTGFEREEGPRDLYDALRGPWPEGDVRLGFDARQVTVATREKLGAIVPANVELVAVKGLVEGVREVKEPEEIAKIRAASELTDLVLRELAEGGLVGRTERAVAIALEHRMRVLGAEGPSFSSIVASGPHGALPHAEPRDVEIVRDTLVTLDVGAQLDGYCSDCTRTWSTGEGLPAELREAYHLADGARAAAIAALAPGRTGAEIDAVARDRIAAGGHGERFGPALGHGVGLEVHEGPRLSRVADEPLRAGQVVTVEPGIYLPGVGGLRIEDLVVITEDGAPDVLTRLPTDLTVVD